MRERVDDTSRGTMAEFSFNLKDITKLFTASGPALPESDAEMILEADGAYAEGVGPAQKNKIE